MILKCMFCVLVLVLGGEASGKPRRHFFKDVEA